MKLNLGCSDRHIEGYVSVDIAPPADQIVDLAGPWPWETSSIEEVLAYDVCEHIGDCIHMKPGIYCERCCERPYRLEVEEMYAKFMGRLVSGKRHSLGRIHFLNELHRVLAKGAHAIVETPNAAHGVGYFQDPTHVSPYCLSTFKYFEYGSFAHGRLGKAYGITAAFKILSLTEAHSKGENGSEDVWKIRAVLEAVKP